MRGRVYFSGHSVRARLPCGHSLAITRSLLLTPQVGYHNEHHDFPSVPWTRLPELRRIAKEFYEPLPAHTSWPYVTWRFITDPSVGMWSRAKREGKGARLDQGVWTRMAGTSAEVKDGCKDSEVEKEEEELAYA